MHIAPKHSAARHLVMVTDTPALDTRHPIGPRDAAPHGHPVVLDPARGARIRERIMNGAYDSLEVVDAIARRLLDNGDL